MSKKLPSAVRKDQILSAALTVASKPGGWSKLTREQVATEAECAEASISLHFGTMIQFRRSVMREAIRRIQMGDVTDWAAARVIGQGIACGDKQALKVDDIVRRFAFDSLAG